MMAPHYARRTRTVDPVDHNPAHELLLRSSVIIATVSMALLWAL